MKVGRRIGGQIVLAVAVLALLVAGAAARQAGRPGTPDPRFGTRGRVVVSLPDASTPGRFAAIVEASGGRFLVARNLRPDHDEASTTIERLEADGAPDPTFAGAGSAVKPGAISALAEDSSGGIVYAAAGEVGRLLPDGAPDRAFGKRGRVLINEFTPASIAIDGAGRILVGGRFNPGARYRPREGEAAVMRFGADGRPDPTFGEDGATYMGQLYAGGSGELALLPDGSMLVVDTSLKHVSAAGAIPPGPGIALPSEPDSLAGFPDGGFAVAGSIKAGSGCTVTRYTSAGAIDPAFAGGGAFSDPRLSGCRLTAAPEGGLLLRGTTEPDAEGTVPELVLLTADGARAEGFGEGGSVMVPAPPPVAGGKPWAIDGVAFGSDGRLVVAGGGSAATLVGLQSNGSPDDAFGRAGVVVDSSGQPSSTTPQEVTAEPDGELIVTGATNAGSDEGQSFWMRFSPTGTLLSTPSGARFTTLPFVPAQLRVAGDDRLYALAGNTGQVVKLDDDGTLDDGFGDGGRARSPKGFATSSFVVDPDGGVTVLGTVHGGRQMAAYRLTPTGRPDPEFGRHGLVTVRIPGEHRVRAEAGATRAGGDLVIAGPAGQGLAVAVLGPRGSLIRDFGKGGTLTCRCGGGPPSGAVAVSQRGHVYVLEHWATSRGSGTQLVKVGAAGLDRTFAGRGYRSVDIDSALALVARGDRLLAVGWHGEFEGPAQVRAFWLDGTQDRSYSHRATVTVHGGNGIGRLAAAMQPGGRLVLAGERPAKGNGEGSRLELLGLR